VGEIPTNNMGSDAGNTNNCVARLPDPQLDAHPHLAGGGTNAGLNCMVDGCHLPNNPGVNAPGYQFAGTVYKADGTTPSPGVTVRVNSGAMTVMAISDVAGNFHIMAGSLAGAFTATSDVTACPTVTAMVTQLMGGNGGGAGANACNLCHGTNAGHTTGPITIAGP
jgi:hypothetical protein